MRRVTAGLVGSALLAVLALSGCPGGATPPGIPGKGGGEKASSVDPDTCGNYAASEAGAKLKAFLEATVTLNDSVIAMEGEVKASCSSMADKLGVKTEGDTKAVCDAVAEAIKANLKPAKGKGGGKSPIKIDYQPAVCTVDANVAVEAAAKCEAKASADVKVECTGSCTGTCKGECSGKCAGAAGGGGAKGECAGKCEGTCKGSCEGGCEGSADVQASAECEAKAEVDANVKAECTEPEVNVTVEKGEPDPKRDAAVEALKTGLPKMLSVSASLKGPTALAMKSWAKTAKNLAKAGPKLYSSLGEQAACVSGQLAAAAGMVTKVEASASVSVEASASVSGAAGAGGG